MERFYYNEKMNFEIFSINTNNSNNYVEFEIPSTQDNFRKILECFVSGIYNVYEKIPENVKTLTKY